MSPRLLAWQGSLGTAAEMRRQGTLLGLPALLWLLVLVFLPMVGLTCLAFLEASPVHIVEWKFTLENVKQAVGWGPFGWDRTYLVILLRSVWVALATTALSLALALPLAFFVARRPLRSRYAWLLAFSLPMCTNTVIRSYAWILMLHKDSPFVRALSGIGMISPDEALYPGALGVYLALVSTALPFAMLPLYVSIERLDYSLVDAARDLKASAWGVARYAVMPQIAPGLSVAFLFTFVPTFGTYVISDLLGAGKYVLIGNVIAQQFGPSLNWPFGATMSLLLVIATVFAMTLHRHMRHTEIER